MKQFFARELALLSLPIVLVAGIGWWASRRPKPKVYAGPQLQFRVEQPTTLQAFDGVKTVLTAQSTKDSLGASYWIDHPKSWPQVAGPQGAKRWRSDQFFVGDEAWISSDYSYADSVAVKQWPAGQVTYGISGSLVESGKRKAPKPIVLAREWKVDRAQIKPFDFSLPRAPLVTLKSVTITKNNYYYIDGEAVFLLQGATMGANTPVHFRVSVPRNSPDFWDADSSYSQAGARIRVIEFRLSTPNMTAPEIMKFQLPKPRPLQITGLFSADNRWPLAFEFEPIDRLRTKVGQKLKFKGWLAPLPLDARAK